MLLIGTKDIHRRQEVDKEGLNVMILQNRCYKYQNISTPFNNTKLILVNFVFEYYSH